MQQLMRRIEEYKRLEDDRLQSKGKAPMITRRLRNWYTGFLTGSNTSRIFDGRTRWAVIHSEGIKVCTALITETRVTQPNSAGY